MLCKDETIISSRGLATFKFEYKGYHGDKMCIRDSDNTAVFELPAETVLNEQKVYLDKKISACLLYTSRCV